MNTQPFIARCPISFSYLFNNSQLLLNDPTKGRKCSSVIGSFFSGNRFYHGNENGRNSWNGSEYYYQEPDCALVIGMYRSLHSCYSPTRVTIPEHPRETARLEATTPFALREALEGAPFK